MVNQSVLRVKHHSGEYVFYIYQASNMHIQVFPLQVQDRKNNCPLDLLIENPYQQYATILGVVLVLPVYFMHMWNSVVCVVCVRIVLPRGTTTTTPNVESS